MQPKDNVGTFILAGGTFTVSAYMGIKSISLSLLGGVVTYKGSMNIGGLSSEPFTLITGEYPNVSSEYPIDNYVIDATAGSVKIIMVQ